MPKMRLRRYLLGTIAAVIITGVIIFLTFDRIALFALSRIYNVDISYKDLKREAQGGIIFEDLKIMSKNLGLGFFSQRAALKPSWKSGFLKAVNIDFKFRDVHFIKKNEEGVKAKNDTLSDLVAIPFEGRWMYKEVSGEADIFSNGLTLKKFSADGRDIRLALSGDIFYNNTLDVELSVYFSKNVLKDIPQELHSVIMRDEPNEWKSFSVKLKGDLNSPSIQVSGKLFRLNIGTVVMN